MHAAFVVHGHFYQPPRENPWTEAVGTERSAAPFHDWNERITAECYRPNTAARIVRDDGRVTGIVNNFEHLSYNIGPTLMSWLERHAPDTYERILAADEVGHGAIAQAYGHMILPLATERDVRTQIRWGIADFEHRFGRPPEGMWLPETAANEDVLAILVEEGVRFTILAPGQAAPEYQPVDVGRPYRWVHPDGARSLTVVFYDGGLSHDVAFGLQTFSSQALIDRVAGTDGLVTLATDGETFGHHHRWGERLLAHGMTFEAPRRSLVVTNLNRFLHRTTPQDEVRIVESAWSCAHGVGRWRDDCGCSTGGGPGWNQSWRGPLREALDFLRETLTEVYERRGATALVDPWPARDAYVNVLLGRTSREQFAVEHVRDDPVEAFTLLEAQRHAMAMYTSCGWFFNDLAGLETVQVLRYAARVIDLLVELGEPSPEAEFVERLAKASSNDPAEGNGRDLWERRVVTARVDEWRAVAHLALVELLEGLAPAARVGPFEVEVADHDRRDRGSVLMAVGRATLTHRRTGRRTEHVYAGVQLGGLEVLGAVRDADAARDAAAFAALRDAFDGGAPVTSVLRVVGEWFGPREFGLGAALPDAGDEILATAARALADRFAAAYERLFVDHRSTLNALAAAGYQLPAELRAPGELALARRLEAEVAAQEGSLDPADYSRAVAIARDAREAGLVIDTPAARATLTRLLTRACRRAVEHRDAAAVDASLTLLAIARELELHVDTDRAQELVYEGLVAGDRTLAGLGAALGIAVDDTGDVAHE